MGREVQRIGLGFVKATPRTRGNKLSPRQWLGKQLERYGRRLQNRTPAARTPPSRKLMAVRG